MTALTWDELEHGVDLDHYRHIDLAKTSHHPDIEALRNDLIDAMRPHLPVKQVRSKFKATLAVLLSNLLAAWAVDEDLFVAYSRDENHPGYRADSQYNRTGVSYTNLIQAIAALEAIGYVSHRKGFQDRRSGISRRSRVRTEGPLRAMFSRLDDPVALLVQEREILVLRDADKSPLPFDDTQQVRAMRRRLEKLNALLADTQVTLEMTAKEKRELVLGTSDIEQQGKPDQEAGNTEEVIPYDPTSRILYRVFNKGSWQQGGRFYGHFVQSLPSRLRHRVRINGEETCELDYSGLHINMLYLRAGEPLPASDVYGAYDQPGHPVPKTFRNRLLKGVLQRLLNAETREQAIKSIVWEVRRETGDKSFNEDFAEAMLRRFEDRHQPIAQFFCSGEGLKLQYQDSLMAEHILMALHDEGIPCIPIHDSFIVQAKYEAKLHDLMVAAAEKVVEAALPIEKKENVEKDHRQE